MPASIFLWTKTLTIPTIFFDNDRENIKTMSEVNQDMMCVKIRESTHPEVGYDFFKNPKFFNKDNNVFDENKFNEGVNKRQLDILNEWIEAKTSHAVSKVDVIFDWDRTLSCVEGIETGFLTYTLTDTLEYLVGGPPRLNYLNIFLYYLDRKKVNVLILTNNPMAIHKKNVSNYKNFMHPDVVDDLITNDYRPKLVALINLLMPYFNDSQLISTYEYTLQYALSYNADLLTNKGLALISYTTQQYKGRVNVNRTGQDVVIANKYSKIDEQHKTTTTPKGGAKLNKKRSLKNRRIRNYKRKSIRLTSGLPSGALMPMRSEGSRRDKFYSLRLDIKI
jgi:hypothetical protein